MGGVGSIPSRDIKIIIVFCGFHQLLDPVVWTITKTTYKKAAGFDNSARKLSVPTPTDVRTGPVWGANNTRVYDDDSDQP